MWIKTAALLCQSLYCCSLIYKECPGGAPLLHMYCTTRYIVARQCISVWRKELSRCSPYTYNPCLLMMATFMLMSLSMLKMMPMTMLIDLPCISLL